MIVSRKGIISLPVRLTVSLLIIALMVPPISALTDSIQDGIGEQEAFRAAEELRENISFVNSRGPSYVMHKEMYIPDSCHLVLGGEQKNSIRVYADDEFVGIVLMDAAVCGDELILYGDVIIELSNTAGEEQMVAVREL